MLYPFGYIYDSYYADYNRLGMPIICIKID